MSNYKKTHDMRRVNFLEKSIQIHGNKFDYSKSEYINSKTKIIIACKQHGDFSVAPSVHWRGDGGCKACQYERNVHSQSKTTQEFITESKNIFGNKFDYSNCKYVNSRTSVYLICSEHGRFSVLPNVHLAGVVGGCTKCGYESSQRKQRTSVEEFIERSQKIHGSKYDYSKMGYVNNTTPITLTCPEHGDFTCIPKNHLNIGTGCNICGEGTKNGQAHYAERRNTLEWFLVKAREIHGEKYDYSECIEYSGSNAKMPIICPKHGKFWQLSKNHIHLRQGCIKCYHDSRRGKGGGGYALEYFERHPEKCDVDGTLYVAHMVDKKDKFLKIGITATGSVKERFYYKVKHGTKITPIHEHHTTLKEAFDAEQLLLEKLQPYRFFPNRRFAGYTECFKINDEVIAELNTHFGININIPEINYET